MFHILNQIMESFGVVEWFSYTVVDLFRSIPIASLPSAAVARCGNHVLLFRRIGMLLIHW